MLNSLQDSSVAEALFDLAVYYDYRKYVEQNDRTAFSLYMRASLLGDSASCSQVAQFYAEGTFVERDDALSKAWQKRSEQDERDVSPAHRLWIDK